MDYKKLSKIADSKEVNKTTWVVYDKQGKELERFSDKGAAEDFADNFKHRTPVEEVEIKEVKIEDSKITDDNKLDLPAIKEKIKEQFDQEGYLDFELDVVTDLNPEDIQDELFHYVVDLFYEDEEGKEEFLDYPDFGPQIECTKEGDVMHINYWVNV